MTLEIEEAGRYLAAWACNQVRLRNIVRRPYAIIGGEQVPLSDVVYHCPEAMQ